MLSRHRDGRAKQVAFQIDAKVRKVRYTLDYSYEEPHHVSWRCADLGREEVAGELVLENQPDGTTLATCSVALEPGSEDAVDVALEDLKARVET